MKRFWKTKKFIFLIIALIAIGTYFFLKNGKEVEFATETVQKGSVEQIVDVNGTVESKATIELRFQRTGKVDSINFDVGNDVNKGDTIASIEDRLAQIEVDKAAAGLNMAQADLNLEYAGPSNEAIIVSETKITEAQVNLNNARRKLNDLRLIDNEKEKNAELEVEKMELALTNAEIAYENALASGESVETKASQDLIDSYKDSKIAIISAIDEINTTITVSDSILGIDDIRANDDFENLLGDKSFFSKTGVTDKYTNLKDSVENLENIYQEAKLEWKDEEVDNLLDLTETALSDAKDLLDQIYDILENTSTNSSFTSTDLENLKNKINIEQNSISNSLTQVQDIIQQIINAKLDISSAGISSTSDVDVAKAILDEAEKNLEIAKSSLEEVKIQNQISENEVEMEIDLYEVKLQQAQANHNELIAQPRYVDVASLQARVEQARASYNQALKELEDTDLISPTKGIITEINIDVGENIFGDVENFERNIVVLMTDDLKITANISESDITKISIGDEVDITLDAFSSDKVFKGEVVSINPAETVIQGVIYYETTIIFDPQDAEVSKEKIKSGMTADLNILTDSKDDVLTISPQAIHYEDSKMFVFVLENGMKIQKYIKTGIEGDDAVEVTSGLEEGEVVILYEK